MNLNFWYGCLEIGSMYQDLTPFHPFVCGRMSAHGVIGY